MQCWGASPTRQGTCGLLHLLLLHVCKLAIRYGLNRVRSMLCYKRFEMKSSYPAILPSAVLENVILVCKHKRAASMAARELISHFVIHVVIQVICHRWGDDVASLLPAPDVITGADIVYQQEHFDALITTLQDLAAPHTLIYLAYKLRGEYPQS